MLCLGLVLAGLLLVAVPPARAQAPPDAPEVAYKMDEREEPELRRPGFFHRASQDSAPEQLRYAHRLREAGRNRKARRALDNLVRGWPDSPEAAIAQRELAELLTAADKPEKAFEAYQYLIRFYTGTFSYPDVLETQFTLANAVRAERHARFFFLPGFEDPARATPLYEQVVENGPNWEKSPEALFMVGAIQEESDDFELAVVTFETLQIRYPRSAFITEAAYRRAWCLYKLAADSPRDVEQCREALAAMLGFIRLHPEDAHTPDARRYADELKTRLADMYYAIATYYDKIAKKPQSAIIAYSDFIGKFPTSERRAGADARVAELQLQMERAHEK